MARTTKGTQQKRRSKGDGSLFPNKRGGWTARYRKKGLPDKEFNAPTKGEAKALLDDWKIKVAIQDAITSNIKVQDYANKYLFRKSLMVEAGKFKQTSLDRLEKTYENHLKDTDAFSKTFSNLTADDITATINAKKEILSYSSLKKIYLFWSAMIKTAISLGELPKNFSDILNRVIMPEESVLPVETKEISIIPPEHEQIIKEIAMEPSPNKNERYLYRYGPAIVFLLNTGLRGGELLALGQSSIVPFLGRRGIKITHTLSRVKNREAGSKKKTKMILTPPKYPNSLRTIPLNKEAEFSLSCMMELYDKNRVFPDLILSTQNGVSPTIQNLANTLKKICKRAEIPEYNLHALRHPYVKHTTKIFSLRLMDFQAQAYPDARRKTRGACQLLRVGQSRSPVRPLCNRKRFSCLPPQSKMSWILYAISMRLSGYTSTRSISSSASSVVSVSASKIALDASMRLSCRACSSCFCFACANTAA